MDEPMTRDLITQDDLLRLPQVKKMIEQERPYFQELFEYAEENYDDDCRRYREQCPDYLRLEPELYYKQVYTWFMCEKVRPTTGKTVLEEFVERFVTPKDPEIARRMLQAKNVIRGSFRVLDNSHLPYLLVEHLETDTRYIAVSKLDISQARRFFIRGSIITGKIHPWGNGYHMFNGILTKQENDEELARRLGLITPTMVGGIMQKWEDDQIGRYEAILVNRNTTLQSAMNRYPIQWVDAICSALGVDIKVVRLKKDKVKAAVSKLEMIHDVEQLLQKRLGERRMAAIRMLFENGWIVKYGQLARHFSTDIGFSWNEHPPDSEIGVLRLHGLVVVGRMPEAGRLHKVALIPVEARAALKEVLRRA
jgi:hypothetical protein